MRYILALLACSSLLGCAGNEPAPEPRFVPASLTINPANTEGICFSALTSARCDHDTRCGFVAAGKRFDDRDRCLNHYNSIGYQSLQGCSTPLDRRQLRQCLASIDSASCDAPLADIGTIEACHYGSLCRALP